MPFPEFASDKRKILFFSRGRGRGHAIPDLAIANALGQLHDDLELRFVSYGTGAATILAAGDPLIDLKLPETGPIAEMSVLAAKLIGWLQPDLVVSHEEFAAIPAAKVFDKPTLFLTDWFTDPQMYSMNALKFADEILFLSVPGVFQEPPWVSAKVKYLGALVRDFTYGPGDKLRARNELSFPGEATVIGVFPGSWREEDTPLLETVLSAFDSLDARPKRLLWLAGADFDLVQSRLAPREDARVMEWSGEIDRLMVACDVAITKTNRKAVYELHYLKVPTIAVSWSLNPADDTAVSALLEDGILDGDNLSGGRLVTAIRHALSQPPGTLDRLTYCTANRCAQLINEALERAVFKSRPARE
jgi:predicted glycosyltransferase